MAAGDTIRRRRVIVEGQQQSVGVPAHARQCLGFVGPRVHGSEPSFLRDDVGVDGDFEGLLAGDVCGYSHLALYGPKLGGVHGYRDEPAALALVGGAGTYQGQISTCRRQRSRQYGGVLALRRPESVAP